MALCAGAGSIIATHGRIDSKKAEQERTEQCIVINARRQIVGPLLHHLLTLLQKFSAVVSTIDLTCRRMSKLAVNHLMPVTQLLLRDALELPRVPEVRVGVVLPVGDPGFSAAGVPCASTFG